MPEMTSRELMISALSGRGVDRVPIAPLYLDLYLEEDARRRAVEGYRALLGDREACALGAEQELEIKARAVEEAFGFLNPRPDWLCWMPQLRPADWLDGCRLVRDGRTIWRLHERTGERELIHPSGADSAYAADVRQGRLPATRVEVDELVPVETPEQILASGSLALQARLVKDLGGEVFIAAGMSTPFCDCYWHLGFEGLMLLPRDNPGVFHYMLERMGAALQAKADALLELGVDGVFIEESLTSADIISPEMYERFVFPYNAELLGRLRRGGKPVIFYMTGDIGPRLERLLALRPAALAFEESKKGFLIDLPGIAEAIGKRAALFGNLDATKVKDWTDADLERELRAQHAAGAAALGFIFSTGSPLPLDTPRERLEALVRTAHLTGRAFALHHLTEGESQP